MKLSRQHAMRRAASPLAQPAPPAMPRLIQRIQQPLIQSAPQVKVRRMAQNAAQNGGAHAQRVERLTVATAPAQMYGCTGLWDMCGDTDIMSLSLQGMEPFLDYLGWERTDVCRIIKNFVSWVRPEYSDGTPTAGYLADACADGESVEWGKCDFTLEDFGLLRRTTPPRNLTRTGLRLCELQPRYRLDGNPITDDDEFDQRIVTEGIFQDLKRLIVTGSKQNAGQFDGLERLVDTGYTDAAGRRCALMDSIVVEWNANDLNGGAGTTWNGDSVVKSDATFWNYVDVLIAAIRRIRQRIKWSPQLASQNMQVGDIVHVAPTHINQCLLDAFTCWRVCPGQQFNETNLNSLEAREYRNSLNGGMFGAGRIYVDGVEIPLINYDWGLIKGETRSDTYLLTGRVGNVRLINGQYNDMNVAASKHEPLYAATDGGRLLTYVDYDNTCYVRTVQMEPRVLMWAPWAQARFMNVSCEQPGGFISPDPLEDSYFPEDSFFVAGT